MDMEKKSDFKAENCLVSTDLEIRMHNIELLIAQHCVIWLHNIAQ